MNSSGLSCGNVGQVQQTYDPLNTLLARLQKVKKTRKDQWIAQCPAHPDQHPSLSISIKDHRILVYCHAGCKLQSILKAVNLAERDLFLNSNCSKRYPKTRPQEARIYEYTDPEGSLLFQVVRYKPKGFRQRRPDGKGGWLWNLRGVNAVPYRLPKVLEASACDKTIFIVEGEKDVHTLEDIGLVATTNPFGAGKWRDEFAKYFKGATVVILPDNDEQGRRHAQLVAHSLANVASSIKIVTLPDLPEKGDVSDWIRVGHTKEELLGLIEQTPEWEPLELEQEDADPMTTVTLEENALLEHHLTDLGNAKRLVELHGEKLRFDTDAGKWLVWNGIRWEYDTGIAINQLAQDTVERMYDMLSAVSDDEHLHKELSAHIKRSESASRLSAMVDIAKHQHGIPINSARLDADPWLINCLNGTLNLKTLELKPHAREDLITKLAPVEYDPTSSAPLWEKFLREICLNDEELIEFLQRCAGYWLTGDTSEQVAFFLVGRGSNGKSTFIEVTKKILGDYAGNTPITTFTERRDSHTCDLAALKGKRLVTAFEGNETQSFNEGLLKNVTGGDEITCRYLYSEFFSYKPTYKIVFATNEVPRIRSQGVAMRRRIVVIPFRQQFHEPGEGDPELIRNLDQKLLAERNGIFAWMVEGCRKWQEWGLKKPGVVRKEIEELFESQDPLAEWLDECCVLGPDCKETISELWQQYQTWCDNNSRTPTYNDVRWFSRALTQRSGITKCKISGKRALSGIAFKISGKRTASDDVTDQESVQEYPYACQNPKCRAKIVLMPESKNWQVYDYECPWCGHRGRVTRMDYERWVSKHGV